MTQNPMQHLVGGWTASWIYQFQRSRRPAIGATRFFYGDIDAIGDLFNHDAYTRRISTTWFDPNIRSPQAARRFPRATPASRAEAAFQPGSYHVRVFPIRLDSLRADGIRNSDVKIQRDFKIYERCVDEVLGGPAERRRTTPTSAVRTWTRPTATSAK